MDTAMKIVIITHYLPYPLTSGGAQAQYNMIDQLRHRHDITLIFNEGSGNTMQAMRALQEQWPEVNIVAYRYYRQFLSWRFIRDKVKRGLMVKLMPNSRTLKVERALKPYGQWFSADQVRFTNKIIHDIRPDLIQVEFFQCLRWCDFLPKDIKRIFVHHEICFVRNNRYLQGFQLSAKEKEAKDGSMHEEISCLNKYDHIITLTQKDKEILEQHQVNSPISVSPAAIATSTLPYSGNDNSQLVFVGGYNHFPNNEGIDWFIRQVAPLLKESCRLDIIGTAWPSTYNGAFGQLQIQLAGFVDTLSDALYGNIMIVPLLTGSGMRIKILEAMAISLPIITTTVGVEGIPLTHGESCLIADTPQQFAQAIHELTRHETLRRRIGTAANRIYMEAYSPQVLAGKRDDIYQSIISNTGPEYRT